MKNAIIFGLLIGILSLIWMFVMKSMGLSPQAGGFKPAETISVLIPLIGLYVGIRNYRSAECGGKMGFLEALIQSFKILIVGGIITVAAAIIFISEFAPHGVTIGDFSVRIFGALLVGVLFALGVSVLLTTKPNKVD